MQVNGAIKWASGRNARRGAVTSASGRHAGRRNASSKRGSVPMRRAAARAAVGPATLGGRDPDRLFLFNCRLLPNADARVQAGARELAHCQYSCHLTTCTARQLGTCSASLHRVRLPDHNAEAVRDLRTWLLAHENELSPPPGAAAQVNAAGIGHITHAPLGPRIKLGTREFGERVLKVEPVSAPELWRLHVEALVAMDTLAHVEVGIVPLAGWDGRGRDRAVDVRAAPRRWVGSTEAALLIDWRH